MLVVPGNLVNTPGKTGPGLIAGEDGARVILAGEMRNTTQAGFIESNLTKRYSPSKGDFVIGVVSQRGGDSYRVSLQPQSKPVRLNQLAFENASRKNRPQLQVGDVVYARISSHGNDMETEIECFNGSTGKSDGFGVLTGGNIISVNLGFARKLAFDGHAILDAIGSKYTYECVIGLNGKIWIQGSDTKMTWKICQWILEAQDRPVDSISTMALN